MSEDLGGAFDVLLDVVLPVFAVAGVGFWYAGRFPFPRREIAELVLRLTGACLVFDALSQGERLATDGLLAIAGVVAIVVGGLGLAGGFYLGLSVWLRRRGGRAPRPPFAAVALPVAFMNAGNLGLPLADLAYGPEGLALATIAFITMSVLHYSLGIGIASGAAPAREVLRLPLVYAAIAGVVANQLALPIPAVVAVPVRMLGETVVPMMLLSLGASLRMLLPGDAAASRSARSSSVAARLALPTALAMLRLGGGWLVGQGVVALFGTAGTLVGDITVLVSALPPAVLNVVVADRYDRDPALVAAAIAIGTAAALITTPLVL